MAALSLLRPCWTGNKATRHLCHLSEYCNNLLSVGRYWEAPKPRIRDLEFRFPGRGTTPSTTAAPVLAPAPVPILTPIPIKDEKKSDISGRRFDEETGLAVGSETLSPKSETLSGRSADASWKEVGYKLLVEK